MAEKRTENGTGGPVRQMMMEPIVHSLLTGGAIFGSIQAFKSALIRSRCLQEKLFGADFPTVSGEGRQLWRNFYRALCVYARGTIGNPMAMLRLSGIVAGAAGIAYGSFRLIRYLANGAKVPQSAILPSNCDGKVVVITGANSGIGYGTALQLYHLGARVILACRNADRGTAAVRNLHASNCPSTIPAVKAKRGSARFMCLDMANPKSIVDFVKVIEKEGMEIDILVNNAGIFEHGLPSVGPFGYELQFETNHLGHFILCKLLMPNFFRNSTRVINVSSVAHSLFCDAEKGFEIEEIEGKNILKKFSARKSYGISKLCNIYMTKDLQNAFEKQNTSKAKPVAYCLHPGTVQTNIPTRVVSLPDLGCSASCMINMINPVNIGKGIVYGLSKIFTGLFLQDILHGSATTVYLCLENRDRLVPAGYYAECKLGLVSNAAKDTAKQQMVQEVSEKCFKRLTEFK